MELNGTEWVTSSKTIVRQCQVLELRSSHYPSWAGAALAVMMRMFSCVMQKRVK